jgi:uncharacterized protein (DUF362 family)
MRGRMSRRTFCRQLAGAAGLAMVTPGDMISRMAVPIPMSRSVVRRGEESPARIAFVRTRDREEGINRALDLLGINPVEGKNLFVKPNFNSADPAPGSTHNQTLTTLIRRLRAMGADRITVGDRSGMGNTQRVFTAKGIDAMAEELDFSTLVFDDMPRADWVMVEPEGTYWQAGFPFAKPALDADGIVMTCCLKTHQYGGHFTLSLKNAVGLVARTVGGSGHNYMSELHGSSHMRRMIADINTAYTPDLIVLDGVEAFVDGGPHQGTRVDSQVILAGTDRVALDAVGVALLRYFGTTADVSAGGIFEQEQIARAVELGLGVDDPAQIELVTGDPASEDYAGEVRQILLGADPVEIQRTLLEDA